MLVFGFLVFKKWVPYLKISLTPNNYRFLPTFITLVTEYCIPSYASNQNCDEAGDGKLDKDRPKKKSSRQNFVTNKYDEESNNFLCSTVNFHMQTRLYPRSYNTARNKIANICEIFITTNYQKIPSQNVLKICGIYFTFPTKEAKHRSCAAAP
jgi:hypothetical protein